MSPAEKSLLKGLIQEELDRIPEEKGDLVEIVEILAALRWKEMLPAQKRMLEEMAQDDLDRMPEEGGDLVDTEMILDTQA